MKVVQILTKTVLIVPDSKCFHNVEVFRGRKIDEIHMPLEVWAAFRASETFKMVFQSLSWEFKIVLEGNSTQDKNSPNLSTETMY